jgi:DNA-binding beta-propeller fold protein YncE
MISLTSRRFDAVLITISAAFVLHAQTNYLQVSAPFAQTLVVNTKAAHKELQKLGLHAVPPGEHEYCIIANGIPTKIGKKSSAADMTVVNSGKPTVKFNEKGKFYDLALPTADAAGKPFGLTVMEIPEKFAKDNEEALAKATVVRDEMQAQIRNFAQLFDEADALRSMQTTPLPGTKSRFDHFGVDLANYRLFATAEDQHQLLVLDLKSGQKTGEISGIAKPHAVLYRADGNALFVTDGEEGALKIFDGQSYKLRKSLKLAKDADSIGYDPSRNYLYIVNGGKDAGQSTSLLSVIDTTAEKKVAEISLPGETFEAMYIDMWRPRLYVNNTSGNSVVVIDRWKNIVTTTWPLTLGKRNVAMASDEQSSRLFVGCRSGQIIVLDDNTGKELQALRIPEGVDDMYFDALHRRLYAIGGGAITTYQEDDADHYTPMRAISGIGNAKTGTLIADMNRYFAAVPSSNTSPAAVQSFEPVNLLPAKTPAIPEKEAVHAPKALDLDLATMSAHSDLRKMGIHAIPPGGHDSLIIANVNTTRIGIKSSDGDLDAVKEGKIYCAKKDDGAFYNVKQPLKDASGKVIGILVMEIPYSSAATEDDAVREGESIGRDVAQQIPSYNSLFN